MYSSPTTSVHPRTAMGMLRVGLRVSSERVAEISNPTNDKIPKTMASRIPLNPSGEPEYRKGLALYPCAPPFTKITISTIRMETTSIESITRLNRSESRIPKEETTTTTTRVASAAQNHGMLTAKWAWTIEEMNAPVIATPPM